MTNNKLPMTDSENKKSEEHMSDSQDSSTQDLEGVSIEDFAKLKIKIGKILSAEKVPKADKLIKFMVDIGEEVPRQILSGIAMHYPDPVVLVGKSVPVIVNLVPRMIRGLESNGMILYVVGEDVLTTLEPGSDVLPGTPIK